MGSLWDTEKIKVDIGVVDVQGVSVPNILSAVATLPARYRDLIYYRYFLGKTLEECRSLVMSLSGDKLSRERIRQIERKGIRMLKHPSRMKVITGNVDLQKIFSGQKQQIIFIDQVALKRRRSSPELTDAIEKIRVVDMDLSIRSHNCLKNAGIETVGQLCMASEYDLMKVKNFGRKSLNEIKRELAGLGVALQFGYI